MNKDIKMLGYITSTVMDIPESEIFVDRDTIPSRKLPRNKDLAVSRQIILYNANRVLKMTFDRTANIFKQNHATAMHAKKAINNLIDTNDTMYADKIRTINSMFESYIENKKNGKDGENIAEISVFITFYGGEKKEVIVNNNLLTYLIKNFVANQ